MTLARSLAMNSGPPVTAVSFVGSARGRFTYGALGSFATAEDPHTGQNTWPPEC